MKTQQARWQRRQGLAEAPEPSSPDSLARLPWQPEQRLAGSAGEESRGCAGGSAPVSIAGHGTEAEEQASGRFAGEARRHAHTWAAEHGHSDGPAEAAAARMRGAAVAEPVRHRGEGDDGRREDRERERSGRTEAWPLATEATRSQTAHNGVHMAAGVMGEGDAGEQSCRAAAASAPW